MGPIALFIGFVLLIAAALFIIWRYWMSIARVSPEEEEFDELMTELNDRQANRISDRILTHPLSDDDAWQVMVRRGRRLNGRERKPRRATQPRLPAPRSERYGGELSRRVDERRDRYGEAPRRRADRGDDRDRS